jgi:hypothetical protein
MNRRFLTRRTAVIAAVAVAVLAGAGAAIAGSGILSDDGQGEKQAFLNDAARRLGVTPEALEEALKGAAADRIDAAVAAGRLTKEQGEALKRAIQSGLPSLGEGLRPGLHGHFGKLGALGAIGAGVLDSVTGYLGLTQQQLVEKIMSGQTLAEIARAQGKSVAGLKQAIVGASKEKLDQAVADGHITAAQREEMLSELQSRVDDIVNGTLPHPFGGDGSRGFHEFRGELDEFGKQFRELGKQFREFFHEFRGGGQALTPSVPSSSSAF